MPVPFKSYRGDDAYIFVSYSHQDSALVFPQLQQLQSQGFNVWFDEGISPGESWRGELANAIGSCDLFLIFITPNSSTSENCQREVNFAQNRGRKILAVHLQETDLPAELEFNLSDRQAIMKYTMDEASYQEKLHERLATILDAPSPQLQEMPPQPALPVQPRTSPMVWIAGVAVAAAICLGIVFIVQQPSEPAGVAETAPPPAPETIVPGDTAPPAGQSIAVLPFDNLSPSEENAFFAAGIHEDVLLSLSKIPDLKVIARKSVQPYADTALTLAQIADELQVANILQGSVRRAGNRVRISVQLIDPATDATLWGETFDRTLEDIFAIQSEIAGQITDQLKLSLNTATTTTPDDTPNYNIRAYELFLRGRELALQTSTQNINDAAALFEQALAIEPDFAWAHAELALVLTALSEQQWFGGGAGEKPVHHANRALALRPNDPFSLFATARMHSLAREDQQAEKHYRRALDIDPNNTRILFEFSRFLRWTGKVNGAFEASFENLKLDPNSAEANIALADLYVLDRKLDEAEPFRQRALVLAREDLNLKLAIGSNYVGSGQLEAAFGILNELLTIDPNYWQAMAIAATNLAILHDPVASQAWVDRLHKLSPVVAGQAQAVLYNTEGKADEEYKLANQLLEGFPREQTVPRKAGVQRNSQGGRCRSGRTTRT